MSCAQTSLRLATEDDVPFLLALRHETVDAHLGAHAPPSSEGSRITNVQPLDLEKVYRGKSLKDIVAAAPC